MPIVSSISGFVAYYGVVAENDEVATISVFEDQAGEEESTQRAAEWVKENLADFIEGTPEVMAGKVAWHGSR